MRHLSPALPRIAAAPRPNARPNTPPWGLPAGLLGILALAAALGEIFGWPGVAGLALMAGLAWRLASDNTDEESTEESKEQGETTEEAEEPEWWSQFERQFSAYREEIEQGDGDDGEKPRPMVLRITKPFQPRKPLVVTFAGAHDGVGKSTTAANFAAFIAKSAEASGMAESVRVLLVDGDLANGDLALRVTGRVKPNLLDLVNHMDQLHTQSEKLSSFGRDIEPFVRKNPSVPNMDVLLAPENPDVLSQLRQEDIDELLHCLYGIYQVIVFDSGTSLNDFTNRTWLAHSSQVYLMVEPEIACLNSATDYAKRAQKLKLCSAEDLRVICIRADMDVLGDTSPAELVDQLFDFVPDEQRFYWSDFQRETMQAANFGNLLTLSSVAYAGALTPVVRQALAAYEEYLGRSDTEL